MGGSINVSNNIITPFLHGIDLEEFPEPMIIKRENLLVISILITLKLCKVIIRIRIRIKF